MIIVASCILPLGIVIGYVGSELSAHRALGRGDLVFTMAAQKDEGFDVLRLLVVGDWGREGAHHQRDVALQMGLVGEVLRSARGAWTGLEPLGDFAGDPLYARRIQVAPAPFARSFSIDGKCMCISK